MTKMKLNNYLDLMIDEEIDSKNNCPICIDNVSNIVAIIYQDIKKNTNGTFIKTLDPIVHRRTFHSWRTGVGPIPIKKLKELLFLWKDICNKSLDDVDKLYNQAFIQANYFRVRKSPHKIKIIKEINADLAYLIGIIYADGSLADLWLAMENKKRFVYEITITDEGSENLRLIIKNLKEIFGLETNLKKVYGGRWYRILFNSLALHRLLNVLFKMPIGYKKGKLKVPELLKKAPFDIKRNFLIGFF